MSRPDDRDPRLAELLSDAVSDVEPGARLNDIRSRTKVTTMESRRPWLFAAGGAVFATAAVVTAIALAGGNLTGADNADDSPGPLGQSSPTASATDQPSEPTPSATPSEDPSVSARVPVYFAGDTPDGVRLFREFQSHETSEDLLVVSARAAVEGAPDDADYRTLWPTVTSVATASWDGDVARIDLRDAPAGLPDGMTEEEARIAVQAVVYTAQATLGQGRVPVQLLVDGQPTSTILGQPTSEPLSNDSVLATLAHVSLTTPSEGQVVTDGKLEVSGVANSFEANVVIRLQRFEGTDVVFQEPLTAEGYMADKLFPFEGSFDISDVPPGQYVLMAMTDDPSGNGGSHTDTKLITVK